MDCTFGQQNSRFEHFDLYLGEARGERKALLFRADFRAKSKGLYLIAGGQTFATGRAPVPKKKIRLEVQADSTQMRVSIDDKVVLEEELPALAFGPGFSIHGGGLSAYIHTLVVEGELSPLWLAKHYKPEAKTTKDKAPSMP